LEGALTCKLEFGEHYILNKKTKVEFNTFIHRSESLLNYVHVDVWGPTKIASLRYHRVSFVDDSFKHCWVYSMR